MKHVIKLLIMTLCLFSFMACPSPVMPIDDEPEPIPNEVVSSAKELTSFALLDPAVTGTISGDEISLTVHHGTDTASLIAVFATTGVSVKIGDAEQVSGQNVVDFTRAKTYSVYAADGSVRNYTVTVSIASSSAKEFTSFAILDPAVTGTISGDAISLNVPHGTDTTSLVAVFATTGVSVKIGEVEQLSGQSAVDFSTDKTYSVHAADGSVRNFTVSVTIASSSAKELTSFAILDPAVTGTISDDTISLTLPHGSDTASLIAVFSTTGVSVKIGDAEQVSGQSVVDFTSAKTYSVHAADGSVRNYTVTVSIASSSAKELLSFSLVGLSSSAIIRGNSLYFSVSHTVNINSLAASFSVSPGASLKLGTTVQQSGTSANNYTSPLTFTVQAADGSTSNYTVTVEQTTVLRVHASVSGGDGSGSSWNNAFTSLQSALTAATADPAITEIWVAAGTYLPGTTAAATFQLRNGKALYGGFAGNEIARSERDWELNVTRLYGKYRIHLSDNRVQHVVTTSGTDSTAILDGFTIAEGSAGLSGDPQGGGIYNYEGSPTLRNLLIRDNYAYSAGGGLFSWMSDLALTNVTFLNNISQQSGGGMSHYIGNLTLLNVHFLDNQSFENGEGGGLDIQGENKTHTLTNVIFRNNTAYRNNGAGMYLGGGTASLTNVVFDRNYFTNPDWETRGGGMYIYGSLVTMNNVTFHGNQANTAGGAWYAINENANPSVVTITNSIIWGNTAASTPHYGLENSSATITYSDIEQSSGVHTGIGNINANPLFVNSANGDLRLSAGSPCINNGNNSAVPAGVSTDLDGNSRFVGTVDMGAYERQ